MVCDLDAVPEVEDASIKGKPVHDGLMLPGNISVTYSCSPGFELEDPDNNAARCEYSFKNREGAPEGDKTQIVTAIWTGYEKIRCRKG